MKTKNCGIYYIQNKITKQLYIGQSKTLRLRRNRHFSHLRKNKHHNSHLQNSFNRSCLYESIQCKKIWI